jgi:hypothetical protein
MTTTIVGMLSAQIDQAAKEIVLTCRTDGGANTELRLHPDIVGGLTVALIGLGNTAARITGGAGLTAQPMRLNGIRPAIGPQGQIVLELHLENGLLFPVHIPPEALKSIQNTLRELEEASAAMQTPPGKRN